MERRRSLYFNIRYIYILVYVVFTAFNKFISFGYVDHSVNAAIYNGLAILGAVLMAVDLFTRRNMLRVRYNGLLVLFFGVYILSMIYNIRFGWVDNAKTLVWMLIQTFMLTAANPDRSFEEHKKYFRIIFDCFIGVWFVGVVISLWQYAAQYSMPHFTPTGDYTPEGFAGGRLFGVFTDPNMAAVCSIVAIILAAYQMKSHTCTRLLKVCYWITMVSNVMYVILSGSRTGEVILFGVVILSVVFYCLCRDHAPDTKWYAKAGQSALLIALSVTLFIGGINITRTGLSYVPSVYERAEILWQIATGNGDELPPDMGELEGSLDHIDLERPDVVDNDDISNSRFKIWSDALKLFKASPILGTSPRNHLAFAQHYFGEDMYMVRRQYSVHNGYLSLLVHMGVLGTVFMVMWICAVAVYVMRYLIRRRKTRDSYYGLIVCMTMALFAIAVSAFPMSGIFFGNSVVEVLFWLIVGYVLYMIRQSDGAQNEKEPMLYTAAEAAVEKLTKKRN